MKSKYNLIYYRQSSHIIFERSRTNVDDSWKSDASISQIVVFGLIKSWSIQDRTFVGQFSRSGQMKFDKGHVDAQRILSFFRTQRWKNHIFWTIFASSSIRMKNVNAEIVETSRDAQATGNYWIIADWSCKTSSFWNIRTRKEKKFHGFFFLNKNIQNNIDL